MPALVLLNAAPAFTYNTPLVKVLTPLLFQVLLASVNKSAVSALVPEVLNAPLPVRVEPPFQTNAPATFNGALELIVPAESVRSFEILMVSDEVSVPKLFVKPVKLTILPVARLSVPVLLT